LDLGLAGKTVIVTGGGSNIGRGITLGFAAEGANVAILELDPAQGEKVAAEARALGGKVIVIKTDVTDFNQVQQAIDNTVKEFGRIDVLVNNVGWDKMDFFTESTPELWDQLIVINYKSVLNCFKAVMPHMMQQSNGTIVSIGSDAGRVGEVREAVYAGCKGAVIALSKSVAREAGRYNIRINVVCPGVTPPVSPEDVGEKSGWKVPPISPDQLEKAIKSMYPLRKVGKPADVANAVLFLASDKAAGHITGQTLSVDGGYTMV
jgi:2-hydroxycyclohexanecarboxyl-CoA dehydrogenase